MKNTVLFLAFAVVFTFSYQNCSNPVQDLGTNTTSSQRCKDPITGNITIANSGNSYTFTVVNVPAADRVVWSILGNTYTDGMTYTTTLNGTFQDIRIFAAGYTNECGEDRIFSATGILSNSACDPVMNITLNPETVVVNNRVVVSLNADASINASTIRWKVGNQEYPSANGLTTFEYTPTQAVHPWEVLLNISATAEFNCGSSTVTKSVSKNLTVNQAATGNAQLMSFEPKPLVANGSTVGDEIYKITRNASKRLSLGISNLKPSTIPTGLPSASGTNCVSGKQCFNLDGSVGAAGSSASPSCEYKDISIFAVGTNDQTTKFDAFIWCYADYCHVGKVKTAAEQCCAVNTYLNNGSCAAVTTGNYSPAGNNAQIACTNKPANSTYTGPSSNGTNNCPWQCNSNYVQSGQTCQLFGPNRPVIASNGSSSTCTGNSCTINVEASYIANPNTVYVDLRYVVNGPISLSIPSSAITKTPLTGTYKYKFTFTITEAAAITKLRAGQLTLHVVSPNNPEGYRWNDPGHTVKKPPGGGGGGPGDPGCGGVGNCQTP